MGWRAPAARGRAGCSGGSAQPRPPRARSRGRARPRGARRRGRACEIREQCGEPELGEQPTDTAHHGRSDSAEQLQQVQLQHVSVACAEAFHHGDRVQAPRDGAAPRSRRPPHQAARSRNAARMRNRSALRIAAHRPAVAVVADLITGPRRSASRVRAPQSRPRRPRTACRTARCRRSEQSAA